MLFSAWQVTNKNIIQNVELHAKYTTTHHYLSFIGNNHNTKALSFVPIDLNPSSIIFWTFSSTEIPSG